MPVYARVSIGRPNPEFLILPRFRVESALPFCSAYRPLQMEKLRTVHPVRELELVNEWRKRAWTWKHHVRYYPLSPRPSRKNTPLQVPVPHYRCRVE